MAKRVGDDQEQSGASELVFAYAFHWRHDGALQVEALDDGGGGGFSGRITDLVHDVGLHVSVVGRVTDSGNRILVEHQLAGGLSSHAVGAESVPDGNWRLRGGWCGNDHCGRGFGSGGGAPLRKCGVQRGPAPNETDRKDRASGEDAPEGEAFDQAATPDGNPRTGVEQEMILYGSHCLDVSAWARAFLPTRAPDRPAQ